MKPPIYTTKCDTCKGKDCAKCPIKHDDRLTSDEIESLLREENGNAEAVEI